MNPETRLRQNIKFLRAFQPDFFDRLSSERGFIDPTPVVTYGSSIFNFNTAESSETVDQFHEPALAAKTRQQNKELSLSLRQGVRVVLFSGIGVGHLFEFLPDLLAHYPQCVFLAVEPKAKRWAAALRLVSFQFLAQSRNVYLFGGGHAAKSAGDFIQENYLFLHNKNRTKFMLGTLLQGPKETAPYIQMAQAIAENANQAELQFEQTLDRFHQKVHTPPRALQSVWATVHREAYIHYPLAKALLRGFAQCGLQTRLEPYQNESTSPMRIAGRLIEEPPDLILALNSWPSDLLQSIGVLPETIQRMRRPRLCWMVDNTSMYETLIPSALHEDDWVICSDRTFLPWLSHYTRHAQFMPIATTFSQCGHVREDLKAPLNYVGSLPDLFAYFNRLPPRVMDWLEPLERRRGQDYSKPFSQHWQELQVPSQIKQAVLEQAKRFVSTTNKRLATDMKILDFFLYNAVTFIKRKRLVQKLLPLGLLVYGPESWREALPVPYKDNFRGFMPMQSLADCYASSQISVNLHSHQLPTALNTRDFDVPRAGGVVLCDWVNDVDQGYMREGQEIAVFRDEDALPETAAALLRDSERLEAIRRAGQERVMTEHTFAQRAAAVLPLLETLWTERRS